ncbi:hypothetical protein LTR51_006489 [Lithohypha guttulata]|nr:hypothetical protein LTR51_006489 [Lithohypha guttulata]
MRLTSALCYTTALLLPYVNALYTPKGSACAVECGTKAQNFTGTGDLVCLDTAYSDTSKGVTLKSCISCLSNSTYVNDTVSFDGNADQYWFLWHMKYVQQYCLIDTPQTSAASNCAAKCNLAEDAMKTSWIYNGVQNQYNYCNWNSSQYTQYAGDCAQCLQGQENGVIIGNFADTMYRACEKKPDIANGQLVTTARALFDSATLDIATATQTQTGTSANATAVATTGATTTAASPEQSPTQSSSRHGLSTGAAAGVGVGIGIALAALVGGVIFCIRRRRKAAGTVRMSDGDKVSPPQYAAQELDSGTYRSELSAGGKGQEKPFLVEAGDGRLPAQELDASGRY